MTQRAKKKLAIYWAAGCGGCEISVVNLHETLLEVAQLADLVFCPCLVDTKEDELAEMPDDSIDVALINGAIRNDHNEEMAHLLRRKAKLVVAYGSCANSGCVPGLSNLGTVDDHLRTVYDSQPTTDSTKGTIPQPRVEVPEGVLRLPLLYDQVRRLKDVVEIDYAIPGCPPEPHQSGPAILTLLHGENLPPRGATVGAGPASVCEECPRTRKGKLITSLKRTWEIDPDPDLCLLDQGLVCMGIATRGGCGGLCPKANMPCIGCYGSPEGVRDQGAAMAAALGSAVDVTPSRGAGDDHAGDHARQLFDAIPDWAGTFYKFTLPSSMLDNAARRYSERDEPQLQEPPPAGDPAPTGTPGPAYGAPWTVPARG